MDFSYLPKVDKLMLLLQEQYPEGLCHSLLAVAAREAVAQMRAGAMDGSLQFENKDEALYYCLGLAEALYEGKHHPSLRPVQNATGIVLHTNLGRAVLPDVAAEAISQVARSYCNLELDLESGGRSDRYEHVLELLCHLTQAEDALVVNNNAAAILLALDTLGAGGEAIISRGELVEIGGSFRVPDILEKTGVTLREVGCTNKTRLTDYEKAVSPDTKLLLKIHPSNFTLVGFVEDVSLESLAALGREKNLPLVYDLGSGCLYPLAQEKVGTEPLVPQVLKSGVDLVCFSGDKLLGGPQAGIILGKKHYIQQMKENPLTRALRVDKFTLAALEATLRLYLDPADARRHIPTLEMILMPPNVLRQRAERLAERLIQSDLCSIEIVDGMSEVGGGSLPGLELSTSLVLVRPKNGSVAGLLKRLRQGRPAVLSYIREDWAVFDPRTLRERELPQVASQVIACLRVLDE